MIDRHNRTQLAEQLRHLAAGLITNDEFEDRSTLDSDDVGVMEVGATTWYLYSDLWEHRLIGSHRLTPAEKETVARWILFLKTDFEYEYPVQSGLETFELGLANLFSLGIIGWLLRRQSRHAVEIWPFFRAEDIVAACSEPKLLAGRKRGFSHGAG